MRILYVDEVLQDLDTYVKMSKSFKCGKSVKDLIENISFGFKNYITEKSVDIDVETGEILNE